MPSEARYNDLHPNQQQLLDLMSTLQFGRIENLILMAGLPVFAPAPRIVREIRFGDSEPGHRPKSGSDFALKTQANDLLDRLSRIGDGRIDQLVVKHGLPFSLTVEERTI